MTDIENLEAWAKTQGYDPNENYQSLEPGMLSPHFHSSEFRCTGTCASCVSNSSKHLPPEQLVQWLEKIREHFGNRPVNINSAYRCPARNAAVGGATNSQHLTGFAVDLWIEGVDPEEVYYFCDELVGSSGGVGKYNTFTHIDCRGYRARW